MECVSPSDGQVPTRSTILVVDDDALARFVLADGLRDHGWTAVEAANADEALLVLRSGVPVDIVVTDIRMPGTMDGLGLARQLRAGFPEVHVIIVSGERPTAEARRSSDEYFEKPYSFERLLERVTAKLAAKARLRKAAAPDQPDAGP